jgi:hypothetical protein
VAVSSIIAKFWANFLFIKNIYVKNATIFWKICKLFAMILYIIYIIINNYSIYFVAKFCVCKCYFILYITEIVRLVKNDVKNEVKIDT